MMVTDHDPSLESGAPVLRVLEEKWDERLDFQDLGRLFHQYVVVFESCKDF